MPKLAAELGPVFQALVIHSPEQFSFAGQPVHAAPAAAMPQPGQTPWQAPVLPIVTALEHTFYAHCYTRRFPGNMPMPAPDATGRDTLVPGLQQANRTRERWEDDWRILRLDPGGSILAGKQHLRRSFFPGEYVPPAGSPPRAGLPVRVHFSRENVTLQPGFYMAFSESAGEWPEEIGVVRFYWNLTPEGAPAWLGAVTERLNRFQVPFRLKVADRVSFCQRTDAAVLYLQKRYYHAASELLHEIYPRLAPCLRPETPLFSKPLAPGVGFAEDPGAGESFGTSRCHLLAEAVWSAYLQGAQHPQARWRELAALYQQHGLDLEKPYLNPGSQDRYDLHLN